MIDLMYRWIPIRASLLVPLNADHSTSLRLRGTCRVRVLSHGIERSIVAFTNGPTLEVPTTMLRESEQEAEAEDRRILETSVIVS